MMREDSKQGKREPRRRTQHCSSKLEPNQSIDSIRKLQTNSIAVDMLTLKSQDKSRAEKNVDAINIINSRTPPANFSNEIYCCTDLQVPFPKQTATTRHATGPRISAPNNQA
jgi:hypothetical protein